MKLSEIKLHEKYELDGRPWPVFTLDITKSVNKDKEGLVLVRDYADPMSFEEWVKPKKLFPWVR